MSSYNVDGQLVDPVTGNFFVVWTEPKWLPYGKVGFEKLSGVGFGDTEITEYAEGDDRFFRLLMGRTKFSAIQLKKGHDKSGYTLRWRLAAMEMSRGVGVWGAGNGRGGTQVKCRLFIGVTDRNDKNTIITKFIFHGAVPPGLSYGDLATNSNEAWEETLTVRFERPEALGYSPTLDSSQERVLATA